MAPEVTACLLSVVNVRLFLALLALLAGVPPAARADSAPAPVFRWERLPPLPDPIGFAGSFAGVSSGALVVAGGANFPDRPPWRGGTKTWTDRVFVLADPAGRWVEATEKLPRPMGYGVSVTTPDGVVCAGGSDAGRHYADVFLLRYAGGQLTRTDLPPLPRPCANACGAVLDGTLYVAGGLADPNATAALRTFWALDLAHAEGGWRELPPWPGPPRMLAVVGAQDGSFFLFSGTDLSRSHDGKPARHYLTDAYRYTPGSGWSRIAELPRPAAAAPSPAPTRGLSHLFVLGGDDGKNVGLDPPDQHPGFPRDVLAYHTITDTWARVGEVPFSLVTTPTAAWDGRVVVPGGEARPGVRSPDVWAGEPVRGRPPFGWLNYVTLAAYLLGMVGIGAFFARRGTSTADYFVGGGRVPWWAAGLSIYATMLSSITFMAIPAKAFATDWTFALANLPILLLAPVVIHCYLPFFRQLRVASAYEYLERRFNLAVRLYGSAAFVLFQCGRMAIVLYLPALALAAAGSMDVYTCILLMGTLCVVYTVLGGIEAVVWTDVVQAVVLLGAVLVSLALVVADSGGPAAAWQIAWNHDKLRLANWSWDLAVPSVGVILLGNLFLNLVPYTSDQAVVQRYLTTRDGRQAARAIWTNALLAIPSTALFFALGTALFVYYQGRPDQLVAVRTPDAIFPTFIVQAMPAGVAGLVIAGVFAAAQSTLSSSLNSTATALVTDFYRRFRPAAPDRTCLRLARWLTALLGVMATGLAALTATYPIESLWDLFNSLIGLLGGGLAGLFALGIFTRRANGPGALAGVAASAAVLYLVRSQTQVHFFLYAGIGIVSCVAVGWLASLPFPRPTNLDGLTYHTVRREPPKGPEP